MHAHIPYAHTSTHGHKHTYTHTHTHVHTHTHTRTRTHTHGHTRTQARAHAHTTSNEQSWPIHTSTPSETMPWARRSVNTPSRAWTRPWDNWTRRPWRQWPRTSPPTERTPSRASRTRWPQVPGWCLSSSTRSVTLPSSRRRNLAIWWVEVLQHIVEQYMMVSLALILLSLSYITLPRRQSGHLVGFWM